MRTTLNSIAFATGSIILSNASIMVTTHVKNMNDMNNMMPRSLVISEIDATKGREPFASNSLDDLNSQTSNKGKR